MDNNKNSIIIAKYWGYSQLGGARSNKKKWSSLRHNGPLFPEPYIYKNIPVLYDNSKIYLDPLPEEYAFLYAKYLETPYIKNKIFTDNFWSDWQKTLPKNSPIKSLDKCDFSLFYNQILLEKESRKKNPPEPDPEKYKYAIVDEKIQPISNYKIDKPGLFIGRGCNSKLGKIKPIIYPEQVTLNIGKGEHIPEPSIPGHSWGHIVHDNTVEWLDSWVDPVTNRTKYIWLGAHADLKMASDQKKFDLARKLKKKIRNIRQSNEKFLNNPSKFSRQIATCLYLIDTYAFRIGSAKGEEEGGIGVTMLKIENIKIHPNNKLELDFLGKDSIRYHRILTLPNQVYKNIQEFSKNKSPADLLFDEIKSTDINSYLSGFMPKLTAKVFRTFRASDVFQKELNKIEKKIKNIPEEDKLNFLLDEYNKANAAAAILCNHRKNMNKTTNKQIENLDKTIKKQKARLTKLKKSRAKPEKISEIQKKIKLLKAKKIVKIELKNIALGTSKINYIDPRISVSFMKKYNIPINKIFSENLKSKFKWAFYVDENFKF